MKCLLVIDMQWGFDTSRPKWLRDRVKRKIAEYKDNGDLIVLVEYEGYRRTAPSVRKVAEGYENTYVVIKDCDDGSYEVKEDIIDHFGKKIEVVEVCGVNLNACVRSTVKGLHEKCKTLPIRVLMDHCNDGYGQKAGHKKFIAALKGKKNVEYVNLCT